MLLTIGKTANGVHVIISIIYIGSGVIVYKISHIISKDKKIAILAATIFILSYDLSIKSLVLNVFHTHATNTFTGLLALLYSIKYLNFGRSKNLILSSLWLLLTIFNYESGLIFIVIIGLFALSQYFKRYYIGETQNNRPMHNDGICGDSVRKLLVYGEWLFGSGLH